MPEDATVLLIPHDGPLGLLTSWLAYAYGRICTGLWTTTTTDGAAL